MKGYIKAAYIFSILPVTLKSKCIATLSDSERQKLEKGLASLDTLTINQKKAILTEFITALTALREHTRHLYDCSIIISCLILFVLILLSSFASKTYGSSILENFLYLLQFGGLHAVVAPYIIILIIQSTSRSLKELLYPSQHPLFVISIGIITGCCCAIVFSLSIPHDFIPLPKISILAAIFAITAVPLTEELFFRGLLFLYAKNRYGVFWSWLFSSVLFATIHLPSTPTDFFTYVLCSSLLCYIASKFSLTASIVAHATTNLLLYIF